MDTMVDIPYKGCGRVQRVRKKKVIVCDGYLCTGASRIRISLSPPFREAACVTSFRMNVHNLSRNPRLSSRGKCQLCCIITHHIDIESSERRHAHT
jgi:hypothetical protein